jgi:hypothetical protein
VGQTLSAPDAAPAEPPPDANVETLVQKITDEILRQLSSK